jgi:hypothetical protein
VPPKFVLLKSPTRLADAQPDDPNCDSGWVADKCYEQYAKGATEDLAAFIWTLLPGEESPLCVTYFDEAHELSQAFWSLLRLLQFQALSTKMWYVFMGTKSSISYYAPTPQNGEYLAACVCACLIHRQRFL